MAADSAGTAPEALARAARHARLAAAEAIAAWRALVDAGAILATGAPSAGLRGVGGLSRAAVELEAALRGSPGGDSLVAALADALDAEIARWEARSGDDPDARAVLRAFLGLRELLWEVGVRASGAPSPQPAPAGISRAARPEARRPVVAAPHARRAGPRVQRVPVEG